MLPSVKLILVSFILINKCSSSKLNIKKTKSNISYVTLNSTVYTIASDDDNFLIGACNEILRIDSSLNIKDLVINGPVNDSRICQPNHDENCDKLTPTNQDNRIVFPLKHHSISPKVISCGTVNQGMCMIHQYNNISSYNLIGNVTDTANYISSRKNTLLFQVPSPDDTATYIIGHEFDNRPVELSPPLLSKRRLTIDDKPHFSYFNSGIFNSSINIDSSIKTEYPINFVFGFHDGKYGYVISNQKTSLDSNDFGARIGRFCLEDSTFKSYTELPISCTQSEYTSQFKVRFDTKAIYNIATAGYFSLVGSEITTKLEIKEDSQILFLAFSSSKPGDGMNIIDFLGSTVCGLSLDYLERNFNNVTNNCFSGDSTTAQLHPIFTNGKNNCIQSTLKNDFCRPRSENTHILGKQSVNFEPTLHIDETKITSLATYIEGNKSIALIGTSTGKLIKALLTPDGPEPIFTEPFCKETDEEEESMAIKPNPVLSKNGDFALLAVSNHIIKFPTKSCSIYTNCSDCIATPDPLNCGWCGSYCGSPSECPKEHGKYCSPILNSFSPKNGPVDGGTVLNLHGDNFGFPQVSPDRIKIINKKNVSNSRNCNPLYWDNKFINCTINSLGPSHDDSNIFDGKIEIYVDDSSYKYGKYVIKGTAISSEKFNFVVPKVSFITPHKGPFSGGANVTITGENLNIGTRRTINIFKPTDKGSILAPCEIVKSFTTDEQIVCVTKGRKSNHTSGYFYVQIDNKIIKTDIEFELKADPKVISVKVLSRMIVEVIGNNFDSIAEPILLIQNIPVSCKLTKNGKLICDLKDIDKSWYDGRSLNVTLTNDGIRITDQPNNLTIKLENSIQFPILPIIIVGNVTLTVVFLALIFYCRRYEAKKKECLDQANVLKSSGASIGSK